MNRYRSARGPLATYLTWLQAGRPNHHKGNFINPTSPRVNGASVGESPGPGGVALTDFADPQATPDKGPHPFQPVQAKNH